MTLLRIIWSKPVPSLQVGLDLNRVALADSLLAEMLIRAEIKKITRSLFSALILNLIKDFFTKTGIFGNHIAWVSCQCYKNPQKLLVRNDDLNSIFGSSQTLKIEVKLEKLLTNCHQAIFLAIVLFNLLTICDSATDFNSILELFSRNDINSSNWSFFILMFSKLFHVVYNQSLQPYFEEGKLNLFFFQSFLKNERVFDKFPLEFSALNFRYKTCVRKRRKLLTTFFTAINQGIFLISTAETRVNKWPQKRRKTLFN